MKLRAVQCQGTDGDGWRFPLNDLLALPCNIKVFKASEVVFRNNSTSTDSLFFFYIPDFEKSL